MANTWETAEISVGGQSYKSFESLLVRNDFTNPPPVFTIMTAGARGKTGDDVTIKLGGKLALTGYINVVQVALDGYRHGIMLQGRSKTQDLIDCQMEIDKTGKNGFFENKTFKDMTGEIAPKFNTNVNVEGDSGPFDRQQIVPGETPYRFFERIARPRQLLLFHNEKGEIDARKQPNDNIGTLTEGKNIKAIRATVSDMALMSKVIGLGQHKGTDEKWGTEVSERKENKDNSDVKRYRPTVFLANRPDEQQDLKQRVDFEARWRSTVSVDATVTVYGWLTEGKSGDLWKCGHYVQLNSPSAGLNQQLWIRAVTYTQDNNGGTQTTLELQTFKQGRIDLSPQDDVKPQGGTATV